MSKSGDTKIIYLMLTRKCNLNCKYCFEGNKKLLPSNNIEMSHEVLKNFLVSFCKDYIKNNSNYNIVFQFTGGEPTLVSPEKWEDFSQLIENTMSEYGVNFELCAVTNGVLLDNRFYNIIRKHNIGMLFSLDGITNSDRVDEQTNRKILDNLLNLDKEVSITPLNVCVTKSNKDTSFSELREYIPYFDERANKIVPVADLKVMLSDEQFESYHKPLLDKFIRGDIKPDSREYNKFFNVRTGRYLNRFLVDYLTNHTNRQRCSCTGNYCGGGIRSLALWPDGTVTCCTDYRGYESYFDGKICKAGDYSFLDLNYFKTNFELVKLQSSLMNHCDTCMHEYYCERPCVLKLMNHFGCMPEYVCNMHDKIYRYYINNLKEILERYYEISESIPVLEDSVISLKMSNIFDFKLGLSDKREYYDGTFYKKINLIKNK